MEASDANALPGIPGRVSGDDLLKQPGARTEIDGETTQQHGRSFTIFC
jgi:hypothetical protein